MRQDPGTEIELCAHCMVDHRYALGTGFAKYPFNAQTVLWRIMLFIYRKAHFIGLRGGIWRVLGVDRRKSLLSSLNSSGAAPT